MAPKIATGGRFGIVPEWLLDADVSALAIRLFAVLAAKHADKTTHTCYPSRRVLAVELRLSAKNTQSVDKAIAELVRVGAITKAARFDAAGDQGSNLYHLQYDGGVGAKSHPPRHEIILTGGRESPATGGCEIAPQMEPESLKPKSRNQKARRRKKSGPFGFDSTADDAFLERRKRRQERAARREATEKMTTMSRTAIATLENAAAGDIQRWRKAAGGMEFPRSMMSAMVDHLVTQAKGRTIDDVIAEFEPNEHRELA